MFRPKELSEDVRDRTAELHEARVSYKTMKLDEKVTVFCAIVWK